MTISIVAVAIVAIAVIAIPHPCPHPDGRGASFSNYGPRTFAA
jgi:hypothetical protein